jgi:uncharacterized protein
MTRADFNSDFEVQSLENIVVDAPSKPWYSDLRFFLAGIFFGIVLIKSEVVSWFRIQEMFRFQSFHMYGVIGSAVLTGMISVFIIKKLNIKTIEGNPIHFQNKKFHKGNVYGGLLFGFGWALAGACPGPLFALIGSGAYVVAVVLLSAIAGTWVYGAIQHRLPH